MRRTHLAAAAALALAVAPAGAFAAEEPQRCDPGVCPADALKEKLQNLTAPTVDDVIFVVRCVGDSLNGAACHQ